MTPQQYIDDLKSKNKLSTKQRSQEAGKLMEKFGFNSESIPDLLNQDFGNYLFSLLKPKLPDEIIEFFNSGFIAVGEINESTPNAFVEKINDSGFGIIFHTGLKDFIYRVSRILSAKVFIGKEGRNEDIDLKRLVQIITEIFWWSYESSGAFGPSYPIEKEQILFANKISLEAEKFFIAHEIGHIVKSILSINPHHFLSQELSDLSEIHAEEHFSDLIAFRIMMNLLKNGQNISPHEAQLSYLGIELGFHIFNAMELMGIEMNTTHPSPSSRIGFIRTELSKVTTSKEFEKITELARGIENLFEEVVKIYSNPKELEKFYEEKSSEVVNELDELLIMCSKPEPPDRYTFNSMAGAIFEKGFSEDLLNFISSIVDELVNLNIENIQNNEIRLTNGKIIFKKQSLLFGFINEWMNEPARSFFLQAFEKLK